MDLFTDTAAKLNQLDLRVIMGCSGEHLVRSDTPISIKVASEKNDA